MRGQPYLRTIKTVRQNGGPATVWRLAPPVLPLRSGGHMHSIVHNTFQNPSEKKCFLLPSLSVPLSFSLCLTIHPNDCESQVFYTQQKTLFFRQFFMQNIMFAAQFPTLHRGCNPVLQEPKSLTRKERRQIVRP